MVLENVDLGVAGTLWMLALEVVSFSVHSCKVPFLYHTVRWNLKVVLCRTT